MTPLAPSKRGTGQLIFARQRSPLPHASHSPSAQRQRRRHRRQQQQQHPQQRGPEPCAAASAVAIPGPLLIDGFGRGDKVPSYSRQLTPGGFVEFPFRDDAALEPKRTPPLVRVRLAVEYRVHSRQMLCVGGSQIPFGWSFLSIAKVPMSWNPRDIWTVEVELPAGTKVEYKYVILEEQDWTQQVNEATEGTVEYTYRIEPDTRPPDIQKITKQMAIVAWQPGPNRILQVPTEDELSQLRPGESIERVAPPMPQGSQRSYGPQALGKALGLSLPSGESSAPPRPEELSGMWEILTLDEDGRPFLDRRDIWAFNDPPPRRVNLPRPLSGL